MDVNLYSIAFEFIDQVGNLGIPEIRTVFLEGQAENIHAGTANVDIGLDDMLDRLFCHELGHTVIDTPPREDDLRDITDHFRLMGKVVGIDPDTMTPDQTWTKR